MIKPWINFAFLYQEERFLYLKMALNEIWKWPISTKDLKIVISVNKTDMEDEKLLNSFERVLERMYKYVEIKIIEIENNDPRILQWDHKNYLQEFLNSDYTHFIYSDADIAIKYEVMEYWTETKKLFEKYNYNFIPGTFRTEEFEGIIRSSDTTYRTDISNLPIVEIEGRSFFSPQEPFQGISIMNKKLAAEHLNSPYVHTDSVGVYGFGYGETAISGYIFYNTPNGFISRVLIPITDYTRCWINHLPSNYASNPYKEHGKIHAHTLYNKIKNLTR